MENRSSMSSRWMGTWPQLIGCALFEIWSLISDYELKEQNGYSTGRLSVQETLMDKQKMAEGFQDTQKGELGRLRQMGEAESGGKDDTIFRLQVYMKYKCLNTKIGKTIK